MHKGIVFILLAISCGTAAAQSAKKPAPTDPRAPAPVVEYRSVFEDYRRYEAPEIADWRGKNEEVGRIGGHVGMHRQGGATKPEAKPPSHGEHK
jgi:hypothetical protein